MELSSSIILFLFTDVKVASFVGNKFLPLHWGIYFFSLDLNLISSYGSESL